MEATVGRAGWERLVLIGFSGTGKSTVARLAAERLGWRLVDTDEAVAARFGRSIAGVFASEGEAAFRVAERRELAAALDQDRVVVATGGGAVVAAEAWGANLLRRPGTLVVALDAAPATSLARLRAQREAEVGDIERPLLAGGDPLATIVALKAERQASYDAAAITLPVDGVDGSTVADEVVGLVRDEADRAALELRADSGTSRIVVGPGMLDELGRQTRARWPNAARVWLISDRRVAELHGEAAGGALEAAGFAVRRHAVAVGEGSKSLGVVGELYDWVLGGGIERGDVVVALGGGVVGDVAGFVAATSLRGVGLVQVPSSLLAMVDSSVGGKTGINHAAGKNLIGAIYQPPLVLIDPRLLATLPSRELTSGWAEIVKHAVIQPSTPGGGRSDQMAFLERNAARLLGLEEPATTFLIRRNVALKAAVVAADEREAGVRALLNFGHTLGHAIEAAGYSMLHGEAIAIGMRAAARIGVRLGSCSAAEGERIEALLDRFGLPRAAPLEADRVMRLIGSDKKRVAGRLRWVVPTSGGGVGVRDDVSAADVAWALAGVSAEGGVGDDGSA